jgi:MscS family membrane protein
MNVFPNPHFLAAGVATLAYLLIFGGKCLLTIKVEKFTGRMNSKWDNLIVPTVEHTSHFFMILTSLYIGFQFSPLHQDWHVYANRIFFVILMFQMFVWTHYFADRWIFRVVGKKAKKNPAAASSIALLQLTTKMVVFSFILLFTLNNLGIKITTILAGLGVGGIAVALAIQKILGDLFSSLSIVMDKPFVVGDFIVMDQFMGEVERIGLKTTRIRSLSGEQIIISNSDLLSTRIRNYKRMHERRVVILLHLTHGLPAEKLRTATALIKSIIASKASARVERCHFMDITPMSLNIETVYFALSEDYNFHMDLKQEILMGIYAAFEREGLAFAYPTQTLHITPTELLMNQLPPKDSNTSLNNSFPRN